MSRPPIDNNMTIDRAKEIIINIDKAYRTFSAEEIQALELSLQSLSTLQTLRERLNMVNRAPNYHIAIKSVLDFINESFGDTK